MTDWNFQIPQPDPPPPHLATLTLKPRGIRAFLDLCSARGGKGIQVQLPRLAAGIVVGFLVLLNGDAWLSIFINKTAFYLIPSISAQGTFSWPLSTGRVIGPLVLVYLYILVEMSNVAGIRRKKVWVKALELWFRGLAYSILVGAVISDLFGEALVGKVMQDLHGNDVVLRTGNHLLALRGWFGLIYPEVICYLSPLAFFIGVFVQLLWEDKPLTERI